MQDVKSLPVTLSERRSARNRQEVYLAFTLIAMERTGIALNQVTIAMAYAAFRKTQELPGDDSHKNWFSKNPTKDNKVFGVKDGAPILADDHPFIKHLKQLQSAGVHLASLVA